MLNWPKEGTFVEEEAPDWENAGSNIMLDFHGDPQKARLTLLSDGNHHMALEESLNLFLSKHPEAKHIFYATTPPAPVVKLLKDGQLRLGNFILSTKPQLFISPPNVLENLVQDGHLTEHKAFFQNQGNVLLIKKSNPKKISGLADLTRDEVTLFLSNPETEKASYSAYVETLKRLGEKENLNFNFLKETNHPRIKYGENIHHREAPQSLADGTADVAVVYYHLALRYMRIFPDSFDFIPLGGTKEKPLPGPENVISRTHIALIERKNLLAQKLFDFLLSSETRDIYTFHGLLPAD